MDRNLWGLYEIYPSSGYVKYFFSNTTVQDDLSWIASAIANNSYLTIGTRFLSVSTIVYFPSYQVFTYAIFFVEISNGGLFTPHSNFVSADYSLSTSNAELAMASIVGIFILLFMISMVYKFVSSVLNAGIRPNAVVTIVANVKERKTANQATNNNINDELGDDSEQQEARNVLSNNNGNVVARYCSVCGVVLLDLIQDVWAWIDLIDLSLNVAVLVYIVQVYWMGQMKSDIQATLTGVTAGSDFLIQDFSSLRYWFSYYQSFQSVVGYKLVMFVFRSAKYLKLFSLFKLLDLAWFMIAWDIFKVFLLYLMFCLMFALSGYIAYGSYFVAFRNYSSSVGTLVRMFLSEKGLSGLFIQSADAFSWFYVLLYFLVFEYNLRSLFLAIFLSGIRFVFGKFASDNASLNVRGGGWLAWVVACFSRKQSSKPDEKVTKTTNPKNNNAFSFAYLPLHEISARLELWKKRRENRAEDSLSWTQMKQALRGQFKDYYEVTDEEVDYVMGLVGVENLIDVRVQEEAERALEKQKEEEEAQGKMSNVVSALLRVEEDEGVIVGELNQCLEELTRNQARMEAKIDEWRGNIKSNIRERNDVILI